jgi:hypothetical protein
VTIIFKMVERREKAMSAENGEWCARISYKMPDRARAQLAGNSAHYNYSVNAGMEKKKWEG